MSHFTDVRGMMRRMLFPLTFLFALLLVVGVHALDFPGSVADFTRSSGGGVLLDVEPSFSEAAIYERLAAYGEAGRANYAFRNMTIDVLLPLGLLPFLYLFAQRALARHAVGRAHRALLLSPPLVYVIFDLAENAMVLILLAHFPSHVPLAAAVLPFLSLVKRAGSLLALVVPLLVFGISFARRLPLRVPRHGRYA